ncbi:F-box/LRR-repeat protein, partial [Trifolium medium]|nr:F-box/LRR-repeat protein [Trifolium medium]
MNHDKSSLLDELNLLQFVPWSSSDDYPFIFLSKPLGVNFRRLTTLHLNKISLKYKKGGRVSPFSDMLHLKTLHLSQVCIRTYPRSPIPKKIVISSPQLTKVQLTCNNFNCKVKIVAPMLSDLMYLHSALWTEFRINFPSIEEGLVIDIKEHEEAETPTAHSLIQLKWTRQEGAIVKVSQSHFE